MKIGYVEQVSHYQALVTPKELRQSIPATAESRNIVLGTRHAIADIIHGKDQRTLLIVGPCSIHEPTAPFEYALKLRELSESVKSRFLIVMRTYFEKPRTITGWKGFLNDPFLDGSYYMNEGLRLGRTLLSEITKLGVPVAMEALEPIAPAYLGDFVSWTAIGARTTESPLHRHMASGLSSPVGFKNNTDGNVEVAVNALKSASNGHHFLGINQEGCISIIESKGNQNTHMILRGGRLGPNYYSECVQGAQKLLLEAGQSDAIMIDCNHDNSGKDFSKQPVVFEDCMKQKRDGNKRIVGVMVESNLHEGKQAYSSNLKHGVSITDGCMSFEDTAHMIRNLK